MTPAVLLNAHLKGSLAAIRSLARRGVPVIAGSPHPTAMGLHSRYVSQTFVYPCPLDDRTGFVASVAQQLRAIGKAVVMAFSDPTLLALAGDRELLDRCGGSVLFPESDILHRSGDKATTLRQAADLGIDVPKTYLCTDIGHLRGIARSVSFPAVVRPRWTLHWNGNIGKRVHARYAFSAEELENHCAALNVRTGSFPMIQDYVCGEEACVDLLSNQGSILAACAYKRIGSTAPTQRGGALKQTVALSYHDIGERAERLVTALQWTGPAVVKFRIDRPSGEAKLIGLSSRFSSSLPLPMAAGADLPWVYYRLACGMPVSRHDGYETDVVSRHFLSELRNLLVHLLRNERAPDVADPSRLDAFRQLLRPPHGCKSDIWDRRDIKPGVMEYVNKAAGLLQRFSRHEVRQPGLVAQLPRGQSPAD